MNASQERLPNWLPQPSWRDRIRIRFTYGKLQEDQRIILEEERLHHLFWLWFYGKQELPPNTEYKRLDDPVNSELGDWLRPERRLWSIEEQSGQRIIGLDTWYSDTTGKPVPKDRLAAVLVETR